MAILLTSDTAPSTGSLIAMIVVYAVIFGAMYLFMFRPQRKEQKRVAAMIAAVEIGDYVLTNSGFYGSVIDITEDTVIVEFGNNRNCRIPMQKSAIAQIEKANGEQQ
ncbi:MAG: preprotein translocase subunit YajC [Lachnospiraceae bacterium]|nr:preprotein translocase subunit YajC [Lachnospiraceae bacterium]